MPRILTSLTALMLAGPLWADDATGVKQTIAYVQKLQTSTGGFTSIPPAPNIRIAPTLRATSAAVRALHYLGGEIPDKKAAIRFVETCWDAKTGGFSDFARGNKVDVFTTAVGLMAAAELKMPRERYGPAAAKFLSENAKEFEDIRIAAAGLESLKLPAGRAQDWLAAVRKLQNADGSFGAGAGQARATGGSVVTLLRLGAPAPDRDATLKVLNEGQRRSGGFGGDDENSADLETTYRVMRCYVMLKARPENADGVRSFVAKCRNEDGGYGPAPGERSNVSATYFAAIIRHWLDKKD